MWILAKFVDGGPFMYAILAVGAFSVFLLLERFIVLYLRAGSVPAAFREQLRTFIRNGDLEGARDFARGANGPGVARIAEIACEMRARGAGDDELQSRLDEVLTERINRLDRRTAFLATVGNIATLLGLLGTISGMIASFAAVSGASAAQRAAMLSKGIAEAMNCTAFGLIVAIPSLVAYALLQSRTDRLVQALSETVGKIYNDLIYLCEPGTSTAKR